MFNSRVDRDLGGKFARALIVAQHAHARQECLLDVQCLHPRHPHLGGQSVQRAPARVLGGDGLRPPEQIPSHRSRAPLEPNAGTAVAGGKRDDDAGIGPAAQQEVGGDWAVAQKAVEIQAVVDVERQPLRRSDAGSGRGKGCRRGAVGGQRDGGDDENECAKSRRVHGESISSKKMSSEDSGSRKATSTPSCIRACPLRRMAFPPSWNSIR